MLFVERMLGSDLESFNKFLIFTFIALVQGCGINIQSLDMNDGVGSSSLELDNTAPNSISAISLYSDNTNNTSATTSYTPDITVTHSATDNSGGSGFSHFEYQVLLDSDDSIVQTWTTGGTTTSFRGSSLNLTDGETYKVQVRAVDNAGNFTNGITSTIWTVSEVSETPYDNAGLASISSLGNQTLTANSTVLNTARTAPLEGNTVNIEGQLSWDTSGHTAVFLRASELNFDPGVLIHANGEEGNARVTSGGTGIGAKGGSGGGGGAGNSSGRSGGNGGSNGNNGNSGSFGKAGGAGTANSYRSGFTYGDGGAGSDGAGGASNNSGLGGSGGNATGGGGGGTRGNDGAGGAGGGGLVVLVADSITGTANVRAEGGQGKYGNGGYSGNGGGGVVWTAFKSYNGNIYPRVFGGNVGKYRQPDWDNGEDGSHKIYQINNDGSLTERRYTDRWEIDGVATEIDTTLPIPKEAVLDPTNLSDETLTGPTTINGNFYTHISPYSARDLTINGTVSWASRPAIFLNVDELILGTSAVIDASGTSTTSGGGASGASGGGGGSNGSGTPGGDGGTAGPGYKSNNGGGPGYGFCVLFRHGFVYGDGGDGGQGSDNGTAAGAGGSGSDACGGGGGGGVRRSNGAGGGGGGGGLVVIIANNISGNGIVRAKGGNGYKCAGACGSGGGGGGGVVWIATKSYNGGITADVSGGDAGLNGYFNAAAGQSGTAKIFQINNDNTLTQRSFTDTW